MNLNHGRHTLYTAFYRRPHLATSPWNVLNYCTLYSAHTLGGGTETNRQCFADICKSWQSRFDSKSRIYCLIDALKSINTTQRHFDYKQRQLILSICTRFNANLTLQTLADIGKALPISLCAAPWYVQYYLIIQSSSKTVIVTLRVLGIVNRGADTQERIRAQQQTEFMSLYQTANLLWPAETLNNTVFNRSFFVSDHRKALVILQVMSNLHI